MRRSWFSLLLIVSGLTIMLVGLAQGEAGKVLQKAITLCLQCMGIG
ncbi:MAG: CD1871A family CXXC motif-containing protein [Bacillota bacterium]